MQTIQIDYRDLKNIKKAENKKAKLENNGFILLETRVTGLETRELVYINSK